MPSKYQNYKQGVFNVQHKIKYVGTYPVLYRSSLELKFMRFCDNSSNVVKWSSESNIIPYQNPLDGKIHKYFCDNMIILKDVKNKEHTFLIEIKPKRKTQPPTESRHKSSTTIIREKTDWIKNSAKWRAAEQYAAKKGIKFIILTEEDLTKLV